MTTTWLEDKLDGREPLSSGDVVRILQTFTGTHNAKYETTVLDFKCGYPKGAQGRCHLTKSICEFANSRGGILVYGVDDDGNRLGISSEELDRLDPAKVQDAIGVYISDTSLNIHVVPVEFEGKTFAALAVMPAALPVVMERNGEYEVDSNGTKDPRVMFREGTILVREGAKGTLAKQRHIKALFDRLALEHSRKLLRRFETVAGLPDDTHLIAFNPRARKGIRLDDVNTGVPVRVLEDEVAATISVSDIFTDEPFDSLEQEMLSQIRSYKTNSLFRVQPQIVEGWYIGRDRISSLDPAAELAFLSSLNMHGFPMYWARLMERETLREIVVNCLEHPKWPDISVIPYVIGAFFWEERDALMRLLRSNKYPSVKRLGSMVVGMSQYEFRHKARTRPFRSIYFSDYGTIDIDDLIAEDAQATEVFDAMLTRFVDGRLKPQEKSVAFQLDIALFGNYPS